MYHCTTYMFSCPSRSMGVSRLRSPAWWASGFPGNLQQCTPWSVVMHICIIYHYVSLLEINVLLLLQCPWRSSWKLYHDSQDRRRRDLLLWRLQRPVVQKCDAAIVPSRPGIVPSGPAGKGQCWPRFHRGGSPRKHIKHLGIIGTAVRV